MSAAAASSDPAVQQLLAELDIAQQNVTAPGASAAVVAESSADIAEVSAELASLGYP